MKLYFQHWDGSMEYIRDIDNEAYVGAALDDLHKRNPKYQSYYQRTWKNDEGCVWIDVGSHSEFYIVKPE